MARPTARVKAPAMGQPYTMVTGPPNWRPVPNSVVTPVSTDTIENVTAKLDTTLRSGERAPDKMAVILGLMP
nr:unnamed protein product [Digitaria exilis]